MQTDRATEAKREQFERLITAIRRFKPTIVELRRRDCVKDLVGLLAKDEGEPQTRRGTPVRHVRQTDSRSQEGTLKAHPEINFGGIGGTAGIACWFSPPFAQHPAISRCVNACQRNGKDVEMANNANTNDESAAPERRSAPSRRQPTLPLAAVCTCCGTHGKSSSWSIVGGGDRARLLVQAHGGHGASARPAEFRSKAEFYSENPTAAELAERARGAMTHARKTRWTSPTKRKPRARASSKAEAHPTHP